MCMNTAYVRKELLRNVTGTVSHVLTPEPVAALTFDDGTHPQFTPRLLQILERHKAHATFFMVGELAQKHPELVRQVAQARHAIGNHSWDHPSFPINFWTRATKAAPGRRTRHRSVWSKIVSTTIWASVLGVAPRCF